MIKCRQCGQPIFGKAKKCPKCGDSLKDEMLERVRRRIRLRRKDGFIVLVVAVILLVSCVLAEVGRRLYSWEEKIVSPIQDKDTHTHQYCCIHDDDGYCTSYCYDTYYEFHLRDGHVEHVSHSDYDRYHVDDNYTYSVLHVDWKPGLKDAPIPAWVFIIPLGIAIAVVFVLVCRVKHRREAELKEWAETGDIDVEGEE